MRRLQTNGPHGPHGPYGPHEIMAPVRPRGYYNVYIYTHIYVYIYIYILNKNGVCIESVGNQMCSLKAAQLISCFFRIGSIPASRIYKHPSPDSKKCVGPGPGLKEVAAQFVVLLVFVCRVVFV